MSESSGDIIRCDACPVLCRIRQGKAGACDRYANLGGELSRLDPLLVASRSAAMGMFAKQWFGHADEVIVVNDHITGVMSEHQIGRASCRERV